VTKGEAALQAVRVNFSMRERAVRYAFVFLAGEQGRGEFLGEGEKMLDALAVVGEGLRAVSRGFADGNFCSDEPTK
jgi:hypothetical protein